MASRSTPSSVRSTSMSSTVSVVRKKARRSPSRVAQAAPSRPASVAVAASRSRQRRAPAPVPRWSKTIRSRPGTSQPYSLISVAAWPGQPVSSRVTPRLGRSKVVVGLHPEQQPPRHRPAWSRGTDSTAQRASSQSRKRSFASALAGMARTKPAASSNSAARPQVTERVSGALRRKARQITSRPADVREGPGRQPRRDRDPRDAHARGDRHRLCRRLLGGRPRRAARPRGRRGVPARPRPGHRELPRTSTRSSRSRSSPAPRPIHPGYGFLAENAAFARACEEAGIVFIGPPAERDRGDGLEDPGPRDHGRGRRADRARARPSRSRRRGRRKEIAEEIGYPVACKAAGGGGGKGFRVALSRGRARGGLRGRRARGREVLLRRHASTSSATCDDPRHVEVQVLADAHGNVIHLGERDCSIQRRHQKLIEEAPAPARRRRRCASGSARSPPTRRAAVDYRGAGTIEGLLQVGDEYFFLEMNTRVQVEHCVTEMVTGIDIVREQILIAAGEALSIAPGGRRSCAGTRSSAGSTPRPRHKNFAPAPGTDRRPTASPPGPGVRVDSGVEAGSEVTPLYDPMVAKLIVWDVDREQATRADAARARRVRDRRPHDADPLPQGDARHRAVGERRDLPRPRSRTRSGSSTLASRAAPETAGRRGRGREGRSATTRSRSPASCFDVKVIGEAARRPAAPRPAAARKRAAARAQERRRRRRRQATLAVAAPGHRAARCAVEKGAEVEEGELICVIEAMKMENEITAHERGQGRGARRVGGRLGGHRGHHRRHQVAARNTCGDDDVRPAQRAICSARRTWPTRATSSRSGWTTRPRGGSLPRPLQPRVPARLRRVAARIPAHAPAGARRRPAAHHRPLGGRRLPLGRAPERRLLHHELQAHLRHVADGLPRDVPAGRRQRARARLRRALLRPSATQHVSRRQRPRPRTSSSRSTSTQEARC